MSVEDRVLRLENAFATLSELAARAESRADTSLQITNTLVQLAVSASERADTHEAWINELGEAQAKLTKAQAELAEAQAKLTEEQAKLAEAQSRTEATLAETNERLNNLINVVERFISGRRSGES
jgi:uncharacterized phage infection (PIP) family protein YhgE